MEKEKNEQRSYIMSKIKKKDTKPELLVRSFLFRNGFRFRIHVKTLPGNPDIVLPKYKAVIMVNGCFWHAHEGCKLNRMPKTREEYWLPKIARNVSRDAKVKSELKLLGWKVITVWECELRNKFNDNYLNNLVQAVKNDYNG